MEAQTALAETTVAGGIRARGRTRLGTLVVMAATGAVVLAVAFAVNQPSATSAGITSVTLSAAASGAAPEVGKPAPDFAALTVDGKTVTLSDFRGTPVWLTFGASWCQPCRAENPDIAAAAAKYAGRVEVVQVYITEDSATVRDYAERVGLTYMKIADPDTRIAAEYRILGIPSHFFIDVTGVMRQMKIGSLDPAAMEAALAGIVP
jgi:peroxiredoxin